MSWFHGAGRIASRSHVPAPTKRMIRPLSNRRMGRLSVGSLDTGGSRASRRRVLARLYAAARLYVNFFQPSFRLKEKRREGANVIKRYHAPATPCERALAHPAVDKAI